MRQSSDINSSPAKTQPQGEEMPGIYDKVNNNSYKPKDTNTTSKNPSMESDCIEMSDSGNEFWSKRQDNVSYCQLQKFWCGLTSEARKKLMKIDKHTLSEHARKNMYCFKCYGLLLEGFSQIAKYEKDVCVDNRCHCEDDDDVYDPSVHHWGGLTTARNGTLTLLDCYLCSDSLKGVRNVFDSVRAREREHQLIYRNACGGYGRGHGGTRETCGLHTARLSVETLVDFWSALGEETKRSIMRMKEEDFVEKLTYRFERKKFCKDCRRNVTREFKELKELKRNGKDHHCSSWFCPEYTAFDVEITCDTVGADWHKTFSDSFETYHHFEWAIGTEEGKSDILEIENVGLNVSARVNDLNLSDWNDFYVTVRAWKMDGHCNELSVKVYAVHSPHCIHSRLVVNDGFVVTTFGESIKGFFEHAENVEEEDYEEDFPLDKDGKKLEGECSRPQKHAKNPERAREFLIDAATVIFKEKVEKAFREGTAQENAHSMFVCLALKLLEEQLNVACKDIITLEKQMKLLEEEEKDKREDKERKERKRTKEKEKKLRRKGKHFRENENKEKKCTESNEDSSNLVAVSSRECIREIGQATQPLKECFYSNMEEDQSEEWNTSFKHNRHNKRSEREKGDLYESRNGAAKSNTCVNRGAKLGGKKHACSHNRVSQQLDSQKTLRPKSTNNLKKSKDGGEVTLALGSSIRTSCGTIMEDQNKQIVSSSPLRVEEAPCNENVGTNVLNQSTHHHPISPQSNYSLNDNGCGNGVNGSQKMDDRIKGFSLFHFGGPVAPLTGFEDDPVSFRNSVNSPHKDFIQEYNLFEAHNFLEFSIY